MSDYIIAENGQFPPQYNVFKKGEDGVYTLVYGPDDVDDAKRKLDELSGAGERARTESGHYVADDPSTPDVNEAYVGGKKKAAPKKKAAAKKKAAPKKKTTKKAAKK
tara:strand:+ start:2677 stop:2997 length:321 start_codon:yes stop_codon:yes gene_type:complete